MSAQGIEVQCHGGGHSGLLGTTWTRYELSPRITSIAIQEQKVLLNNLEIIFLTTSFSLVGVVDWVPDLLPTLKA